MTEETLRKIRRIDDEIKLLSSLVNLPSSAKMCAYCEILFSKTSYYIPENIISIEEIKERAKVRIEELKKQIENL